MLKVFSLVGSYYNCTKSSKECTSNCNLLKLSAATLMPYIFIYKIRIYRQAWCIGAPVVQLPFSCTVSSHVGRAPGDDTVVVVVGRTDVRQQRGWTT